AALDQTVTATTPGGTATVNLSPEAAGELEFFAVGFDGTRQSAQPAVATATVAAPASLSGLVFTPDGLFADGATVMVAQLGLSTTADANGAFDFGSITPGTYKLAATFGDTACGLSYATDITITVATSHEIWLTAPIDSFGYSCVAEDSTTAPYVALNNP